MEGTAEVNYSHVAGTLAETACEAPCDGDQKVTERDRERGGGRERRESLH